MLCNEFHYRAFYSIAIGSLNGNLKAMLFLVYIIESFSQQSVDIECLVRQLREFLLG